jgi:predicted component of type VI protein secretion system
MSIEIGKDGAYLELNVEKMDAIIDAVRYDQQLEFKSLTILAQRVELSDEKHIKAIKIAFSEIIDSLETEGFDNKQMGVYVFKKIFEKGLETFIKE